MCAWCVVGGGYVECGLAGRWVVCSGDWFDDGWYACAVCGLDGGFACCGGWAGLGDGVWFVAVYGVGVYGWFLFGYGGFVLYDFACFLP